MALTSQQTRTLIAGAQERAREKGLRVTVAVVDEGGLLQALERMDGAFPLSARIAEAKAAGSAVWHRDGGDLAAVQRERGAFFEAVSSMARLPLIPGAGSLVLRQEGVVVGAVGVSGATADEDLDCAEAGVAALAL